MCEFCTARGEGKQCNLKMRNYSEELLHAELFPAQQENTGTRTRSTWVNGFWEEFVIPAVGKVSKPSADTQEAKSLEQHDRFHCSYCHWLLCF